MTTPDLSSLTGIQLEQELVPGSAEWLKAMTASKVPSVLNLPPHKWDTAYSLWHKMKGISPPDPQTDTMGRGHQFEPLIRGWVQDANPEWDVQESGTWKVEGADYHANPDGLIVTDQGVDLLEVKTAADFFEWDGVPARYRAQAQWQMFVTGARTVWFAVCGPFELFDRRPRMIEEPFNPNIVDGMVRHVDHFMQSLAGDVPPARISAEDADMRALQWRHPTVEKVPPLELPPEVALPYLDALRTADRLKTEMSEARAILLEYMGSSYAAEFDGHIIATRTNGTPPSLRKASGADKLIKEHT